MISSLLIILVVHSQLYTDKDPLYIIPIKNILAVEKLEESSFNKKNVSHRFSFLKVAEAIVICSMFWESEELCSSPVRLILWLASFFSVCKIGGIVGWLLYVHLLAKILLEFVLTMKYRTIKLQKMIGGNDFELVIITCCMGFSDVLCFGPLNNSSGIISTILKSSRHCGFFAGVFEEWAGRVLVLTGCQERN